MGDESSFWLLVRPRRMCFLDRRIWSSPLISSVHCLCREDTHSSPSRFSFPFLVCVSVPILMCVSIPILVCVSIPILVCVCACRLRVRCWRSARGIRVAEESFPHSISSADSLAESIVGVTSVRTRCTAGTGFHRHNPPRKTASWGRKMDQDYKFLGVI
jgi:hypothetical protein